MKKDRAECSRMLVDEVARLHRLMHRIKASLSASPDRSSYALLFVISHAGPQRVADLASAVLADASTVSRQAAELVNDGLLRREPDPDDGRASLLGLTDAGRARIDDLTERRLAFFADIVADWTEDELVSFGSLLNRFVDGLEHGHACLVAPTGSAASTDRISSSKGSHERH
ncbi:MAG: MarR family winged helix-turn-helix transcriptional regulator [Nocardioidaceae bacterium]